jgi:hypothetical protein
MNPYIMPAVVTKLLLTIFVWFMVNETKAKRKLIIYKRLGISTIKLFSILFLVDISITLSFLMVIKEYI